jgi:hypothetical protein
MSDAVWGVHPMSDGGQGRTMRRNAPMRVVREYAR